MYLNSKYIGEPQKIEFPMYLKSEVYWKYIGNRKYFLIPMYYHYINESWYIGIEISMPIPMYGGSNLSRIYIGMGQYRLFPMYRQKLPKQNTSEFRVFIQSRCIPINFPRFYSLFLEVYPRANQPHFNFPRIYLHPLRSLLPRQSTSHNTTRAIHYV